MLELTATTGRIDRTARCDADCAFRQALFHRSHRIVFLDGFNFQLHRFPRQSIRRKYSKSLYVSYAFRVTAEAFDHDLTRLPRLNRYLPPHDFLPPPVFIFSLAEKGPTPVLS